MQAESVARRTIAVTSGVFLFFLALLFNLATDERSSDAKEKGKLLLSYGTREDIQLQKHTSI